MRLTINTLRGAAMVNDVRPKLGCVFRYVLEGIEEHLAGREG